MKILSYVFTLLFVTSTAYAETAKTEIKTYLQDKPAIMVESESPVFIIKLKSNPTTGYSWFLREYHSNVLEPVKHEFEAVTDKKLVGAPGYELWTFRVKPEGFVVPQQSVIRFVYLRPWDAAETPTQVLFKVTTMGDSKVKGNAKR